MGWWMKDGPEIEWWKTIANHNMHRTANNLQITRTNMPPNIESLNQKRDFELKLLDDGLWLENDGLRKN